MEIEQECPNCLSTVDLEGKAEGSFVVCKSCSLQLRVHHGVLVDATEATLERGYF